MFVYVVYAINKEYRKEKKNTPKFTVVHRKWVRRIKGSVGCKGIEPSLLLERVQLRITYNMIKIGIAYSSYKLLGIIKK